MKTRFSRNTQHVCSLLLATLLSNGGCGVEVGNPHGTKGGSTGSSGSVSVALADAPIDNLRHVYFNLKSLSAIDINGDSFDLELATTGKVDALDLQNGKSLALATGQSLNPGDYSAALLELDPTTPATTVDAAGVETPLPFANGSHEIYIQQAFSVTAGEDLDLVLHVDLRASLTQLTDKKGYQFGPQASMLPRGVEAIIVGSVTDTSLLEVCAYRSHNNDYTPGSRLPHGLPGGYRQRPSDGPQGGPLQPPPPPPGSVAQARQPHSFDPDDDKQSAFDTSTGCSNAFATALISNGGFSLHHLWPGNYKLRFFRADGTHIDGDGAGINVGPGETGTTSLSSLASNAGGTTGNAGGTTGNAGGTTGNAGGTN